MFVQAILYLFLYFTMWYIIGLLKKNAGVVDIGWGMGFVILSWFFTIQNPTLPSILTSVLVSIWGLRLSSHIYRRNHRKPEDFRYADFRNRWGKIYYIRSYFQLFLLQGVFMLLISLSFLYISQTASITILPLFILGITIWVIGFFFESMGDHQLRKFIADPQNKNKLIQTGLWKYTRHPNYFGEATMWWGIFIMGLSCGTPLYTILSPITITILVCFVSGIPMLEKGLTKYPDFLEYKERTSIFIPWFPKSKH